MKLPWLAADTPFPPAEFALTEPDGLLAAGADLSVQRLTQAYSSGIFPWYSEGEPVLWWSPDPRMVLFPQELHVPRSLAKVLRNRPYTVRLDTAFERVMACCAAPRHDDAGTWISTEMCVAYGELHRQGYAHSVETWIGEELVGGLYGVAIGNVFYGESMFALQPDASKIAFANLVPWLASQGFCLIDCQMRTAHLTRFGGREIPRHEFSRLLAEHVVAARSPAPWLHEWHCAGRAA